jgi:tRNA threonylcarbamoyladenosine biosynthesis protein TsaE
MVKKEFARVTHNEHQTMELGEEIARSLKAGAVIALYGDLGSGKTCLARGICRGLGVEGTVNSPTFVIVNHYKSVRGNVYHFDFYRLSTQQEVFDLGFNEYVKDDSVIIIEWPEIVEEILPRGTIKIRLSYSAESENHRWIKIEMN